MRVAMLVPDHKTPGAFYTVFCDLVDVAARSLGLGPIDDARRWSGHEIRARVEHTEIGHAGVGNRRRGQRATLQRRVPLGSPWQHELRQLPTEEIVSQSPCRLAAAGGVVDGDDEKPKRA